MGDLRLGRYNIKNVVFFTQKITGIRIIQAKTIITRWRQTTGEKKKN